MSWIGAHSWSIFLPTAGTQCTLYCLLHYICKVVAWWHAMRLRETSSPRFEDRVLTCACYHEEPAVTSACCPTCSLSYNIPRSM